jgi:hypothetical protein
MNEANPYMTPDASLDFESPSDYSGGTIEDAIAGNIEISMTATMGQAWRDMKGFKTPCLLAFILYFVAAIITSLIAYPVVFGLMSTGADANAAGLIGSVIQLFGSIAIMPMFMGIHIMGMRHAESKSVSVGSIFSYFSKIPSVFLCYIIMTILFVLGMMLLILPGIYLMVAYMFAMPLVVEKNMSAWQALEISRKVLTRKWFPMLGLLFLVGFVNMLAILTLGIALIWTIPWSVLTMSMVYTKLFGAEPHTLAD